MTFQLKDNSLAARGEETVAFLLLGCFAALLALSYRQGPSHYPGLWFISFLIHVLWATDAEGRVLVAKTGLGSSAALVTSLLGALLQFFGVVRLEESKAHDKDIRIVHNLAQLVHSHAQGKIGSGFDVSAAVFGKQGIHLNYFQLTCVLGCL